MQSKLSISIVTLALLAVMVVGCPAPTPSPAPTPTPTPTPTPAPAPPPTPSPTPTPSPKPTPTPERIVTERVIVEIDRSSWILGSLTVSPDSRRVAYVVKEDTAEEGSKQVVVVDGTKGKRYDTIFREVWARRQGRLITKGSLIFSADSQRVAYVAEDGSKQVVVVDGMEGKRYAAIEEDSIIFSPDSKRVAYVATNGNKQFVVVDGMEGKQYDVIVTPSGGKISFDSPDSFHYLAFEGDRVYLVEESQMD